VNAIRNGAKLSISEGFPQNLLPNIQPVMDMTPAFHRTTNLIQQRALNTSSGASTIFTTSTEHDTYITGFSISLVKDATNDTASGAFTLSATVDSVVTILGSLAVLTLAAQDQTLSVTLKHPVKISKGTALTMGSLTYTAGTCSRSMVVYGYTCVRHV